MVFFLLSRQVRQSLQLKTILVYKIDFNKKNTQNKRELKYILLLLGAKLLYKRLCLYQIE